MKLLVKKLSHTATIPTVTYPGEDLGYDLYVDLGVYEVDELSLDSGCSALLPTGISVRGFAHGKPVGFLIKDRSSVASKLHLYTHAGVIDAGYTGEIKILAYNAGTEECLIYHGQKIAQLVPFPVFTGEVEEVDDLGESMRGSKGFGSSGV